MVGFFIDCGDTVASGGSTVIITFGKIKVVTFGIIINVAFGIVIVVVVVVVIIIINGVSPTRLRLFVGMISIVGDKANGPIVGYFRSLGTAVVTIIFNIIIK